MSDYCSLCGHILEYEFSCSECDGEEVKNFEAKIKQLERRFPMLDGPDIDWATAEKIYEIYSILYTNDQTLERIAERGGFGWGEVKLMVSKSIGI